MVLSQGHYIYHPYIYVFKFILKYIYICINRIIIIIVSVIIIVLFMHIYICVYVFRSFDLNHGPHSGTSSPYTGPGDLSAHLPLNIRSVVSRIKSLKTKLTG
jgi:hypothetical protein